MSMCILHCPNMNPHTQKKCMPFKVRGKKLPAHQKNMHKITKMLWSPPEPTKFSGTTSACLVQKSYCRLRDQAADIDFRTSGVNQFPDGVTTGPDHMFHLRSAARWRCSGHPSWILSTQPVAYFTKHGSGSTWCLHAVSHLSMEHQIANIKGQPQIFWIRKPGRDCNLINRHVKRASLIMRHMNIAMGHACGPQS